MEESGRGTMAVTFGHLVGSWGGTNGFRMMPTDDLQHTAATAQLSIAAGGHCLLLAYTWVHPTDGPQDGVLLVSAAPEDEEPDEHLPRTDSISAAWCDSWHQQPAMRILSGTIDDRQLQVEAGYGGGWRWSIALDGGRSNVLGLTMCNIVPDEYATDEVAAGPYPVMVGELRREA